MIFTKEEYYANTRVDAVCAVLASEDILIIDAYGPTTIGMTVEQAEFLLGALTQAITQAKEVYAELDEYMGKPQEVTPDE